MLCSLRSEDRPLVSSALRGFVMLIWMWIVECDVVSSLYFLLLLNSQYYSVRGCSPEHFLFTRAIPTRSFASPRGLYKVFLACSLHSVVRAFFTRSRSRFASLRFASLRFAQLCFARAFALLVPRSRLCSSRASSSASSPRASPLFSPRLDTPHQQYTVNIFRRYEYYMLNFVRIHEL